MYFMNSCMHSPSPTNWTPISVSREISVSDPGIGPIGLVSKFHGIYVSETRIWNRVRQKLILGHTFPPKKGRSNSAGSLLAPSPVLLATMLSSFLGVEGMQVSKIWIRTQHWLPRTPQTHTNPCKLVVSASRIQRKTSRTRILPKIRKTNSSCILITLHPHEIWQLRTSSPWMDPLLQSLYPQAAECQGVVKWNWQRSQIQSARCTFAKVCGPPPIGLLD